jgi:tetratricopeptide (TPR) repeat protein
LLIGVLGAIFSFRSDADFPVAAPGEQLVIIAQFQAARPLATPDAPSRRLPGENVGTASDDFASRMQIALEREVRAARMDNVRVVTWRAQIRDANAAEAFRQRANASIVIWGNASDNKFTAALAVAPLASRADDMPLDALIAAPTDAALTIGESAPDEMRAFALLALSQLYLAQGDSGMARASLTQALARPPQDQRALAMLNLHLAYVLQISKPPELGNAIQFYSQTIALAPDHSTAYLNQGVAYIRLDDAAGWQADFARVLLTKPDQFNARLALCWANVLDQKLDLALPHCDAAVSRDSSARSREARAIVYAEMGRLPQAVADLQMFVDWLAHQPASLRTRYGTSRADWLQSLGAGKNPVDAAILGRLRQE